MPAVAYGSLPRLRFLGTGASVGVPSFFCDCPACQEALADPGFSRGASSLLIQSADPAAEDGACFNTLIDTAQELRLQLLGAQVRTLDALVFTHEHNDHVSGLGVLEYYLRLQRAKPLPVYASAIVIAYLETHFDFMIELLDLHEIKPFAGFSLGGLSYLPLTATHNKGCLGYLISVPGDAASDPAAPAAADPAAAPTAAPAAQRRCAYFPDSSRLSPPVQDLVRGSDIIIFDSTFNGDNWMPDVHMDIDSTMRYLCELDCRQGYLTHLAMSYDTPITAAELQRRLAGFDPRLKMATDGLVVDL